MYHQYIPMWKHKWMLLTTTSTSTSTVVNVTAGTIASMFPVRRIVRTPIWLVQVQQHSNNNNINYYSRCSNSASCGSITSTSNTNTRLLFFSSYSRMLDLGGSPSSINDTTNKGARVDVSKNCKVQAVLFDFDILTQSMNNNNNDTNTVKNITTPLAAAAAAGNKNDDNSTILGKVIPNIALIEDVTNLLRKTRGTRNGGNATKSDNDDDLSILLGTNKNLATSTSKSNDVNSDPSTATTTTTTTTGGTKPISSITSIGAKYSDKLAKRGVEGGIQGLMLTKQQQQYQQSGDTITKGDAIDHIAARRILATTAGTNRWMASSGAGTLLKYISHRCMKIILLPSKSTNTNTTTNTNLNNNDDNNNNNTLMDEFTKQLEKDVHFTYLHKDGTQSVDEILSNCINEVNNQSTTTTSSSSSSSVDVNGKRDTIYSSIMIVSDKDSYLRVAKNLGLTTVRLCPPNSRRGNVSCHYTIQNISETQDIINQINGISFSTVLKSR